MVAMARMTQRGETITSIEDFEKLLEKPYTATTAEIMTALPHPTIQKFGVINIIIVGASRRFLAQITRHQNEVKFMSGSLQYSDYSNAAQFVVPYEITAADASVNTSMHSIPEGQRGQNDRNFHNLQVEYLEGCKRDLKEYKELAKLVGRDAAGYKMPQGMRNVLLISATPYQWKHMISQRICNRNTLETQYTMLKCWEALAQTSVMFNDIGPSCIQNNKCDEGKMTCGHFLRSAAVDDYMQKHVCSLPTAILNTSFKLIRRE